jgi:hypothetical protein
METSTITKRTNGKWVFNNTVRNGFLLVSKYHDGKYYRGDWENKKTGQKISGIIFGNVKYNKMLKIVEEEKNLSQNVSTQQHNYETEQKDYSLKDIEDILNNPFTKSRNKIEYGKMVASVAQCYIELKTSEISNKQLLVNPEDYPELKKNFNYVNNGAGFDLLSFSKKRIQVKFRQVDGKTPYSRQVLIENTRRHSEKNQGNGDGTGHVVYADDEFDYLLVILCHLQKNNKTKPSFLDWSFSLIPIEELKDVNKLGYLRSKIQSETLLKYKCDDIYMLTKKLEEL